MGTSLTAVYTCTYTSNVHMTNSDTQKDKQHNTTTQRKFLQDRSPPKTELHSGGIQKRRHNTFQVCALLYCTTKLPRQLSWPSSNHPNSRKFDTLVNYTCTLYVYIVYMQYAYTELYIYPISTVTTFSWRGISSSIDKAVSMAASLPWLPN